MYCQTLSAVNHPPNCSTQQFLKVKTACKKACAALVASFAPPIKSSRKKAMIPSSSLNTGGEACAAGEPATFVRKAALWCSYAGQCNNTWCTDSILSGSPQVGHMRSCVSWLG